MTIFGFTPTQILAFIGALSIILGFIKLLFDVIPRLGSLKTSVYKSLATTLRHKGLERRAIASNIENVVNESVAHLQHELPPGWISKARIQWVKEENASDLEDGELILRIRPIDDQDRNLMNGIYYYFSKAIFPRVREVVPPVPKKAAILQLSKRTVSRHHPFAIGLFEDRYLEPAIQQEARIAYYLDSYQTMDVRGFFTGVFLREASDLAQKVRFTEQRAHIANELDGIVDQIVKFITDIGKSANVPDELWYKKTATCSYAFLLVARPFLGRKATTYVNRAKARSSNGIEKLYVLGADAEKAFVSRVITAIASDTDYMLSEQIELYRDYRGEPGGVCAVFQLHSAAKSRHLDIGEQDDTVAGS